MSLHVRFADITKDFGPVRVLHGVSFELQPGALTLIGAEQDVWLRLESERSWITRLWQRLARPAHHGSAATVAG